MKHVRWQLVFGVALVALSAALYLAHYVIFADAHHIFIYLLGDIAFVPMEVLLVTLILHELLTRREKRALLGKMNMVIGAFFSEVGTELLDRLSRFDTVESQPAALEGMAEWTGRQFTQVARHIADVPFELDSARGDLGGLSAFLAEKRSFLVALLENPILLEHQTFTNLLWGVLHLAEELAARPALDALPDDDLKHLSGDMRRAHRRLIAQWLAYMRHLKRDYPYLFSLAVRTNPFDPAASAVVG